MKTLDEVIEELENLTTCDGTGYSYIADDDADDALHYLRGYREVLPEYAQMKLDAVKNDPLTWQDLKQMEGKPVWTVESTVTYDDNGIERIGRWNIIREVTQEQIIFYIGLPYHKSWQGIGWQVFRKERK